MNLLPRLASRVLNRPVMIHPHKAEVIVAAIAGKLGVTRMVGASGEMTMLDGGGLQPIDAAFTGEASDDPGYDMAGPVAVIPVSGTLVHRLGYLRPVSGITGYDGIRQAFLSAMSEPAVKAIVLDIDSPGGEVSGAFDLADQIAGMRGVKPVWAICDEFAYSAAYALASACDFITMPRTGGVGSVGVVCMHVDYAKALETAGITVTLIQYGEHKTDGNQFMPLASDARKQIQAEVNTVGEMFVSLVATNRKMAAGRVRGTGAACFMGQDGVAAGLADAVLSPDAAFRELIKQL